MSIAFITGSSGLVGSEAVDFFIEKGFEVIGVDNNSRKFFFGKNGDTLWRRFELEKKYKKYHHYDCDITNYKNLEKIFRKYKNNIKVIIHAAAQPSHDWALKNPILDFSINASGTLNLLELFKKYSYESTFIFVSTNKVYGDTPNKNSFIEKKKRWELNFNHKNFNGFDEKMSIDNSIHSLFGVSKCSADLLTQEYGKNLKLKTGVFRAGCITGKNHSSAKLHGFLNYLIKANIKKVKYTIHGYKGKQVRDNIHSYDLLNIFWHYFQKPKHGEVYNVGGTRSNSCSILEAIEIIENVTKIKTNYNISKINRMGDHKWYITDMSKFKKDFTKFKLKYSLEKIIDDIASSMLVSDE